MQRSDFLSLIDDDLVRRAAISHALTRYGIHVEPFEAVAELHGHWPGSGMILAHDRDGTLPALVGGMTERGCWLPVVAFAQAPEPKRIVDAILGGAIDYIAWPLAADDLARTLTAARGRAARLGGPKAREARARGRIQRLTQREREVLACVAEGLSSRKIGEKLAISPRTVEIHRANMLTKIGANHTSEAIRIAIEAALVQ